MARDLEFFAPSEEYRSMVGNIFLPMAVNLFAYLPHAQVVHVGSTSVPGCLTAGDIDILVRVQAADFAAAVSVLDDVVSGSSRTAPTDQHVEYEYLGARDLSGWVELVVAGSELDLRLLGLKAVLLSDPTALEGYNALKVRSRGCDMASYQQAKQHLIDDLLDTHAAGAMLLDPDAALVTPGIFD